MKVHPRTHCHTPIRVIIADAYPVLRTGLIATIEADAHMQVVGTVLHRHELIPQLGTTAVDVLIINLVRLGDAHVSLLHSITRAHPRLGIVVFATVVDFAPELVAAGAHAYVSCTEPDEQLHIAIRAAHAKQRYLSPLTQDYVDRYTRLASKQRFQPRELEIIKCIAAGLDVSATADFLDMRYATVKNYIYCIRNKSGWTTWPQMVSWYHTLYGSEGMAGVPLHLQT